MKDGVGTNNNNNNNNDDDDDKVMNGAPSFVESDS
jgi:hypothetical protein